MNKGFSITIGSVLTALILFGSLFLISYWYSSNSISNTPTAKAIVSPEKPYTYDVSSKREEVEQIIRNSLIEAIKEVERYGGYLLGEENDVFPKKTVDFRGGLVPYYRVCGETKYPTLDEIKEKIRFRFIQILDENMRKYVKGDENLEYSGADFDITILDGKIRSLGNVYVSYKGNSIPLEYQVDIPTRLKEIYEYVTSFSEMMSETRLLDYLFLNTLYMAKQNYFPTWGTLTKCGERIEIDNIELTRRFMYLYDYFLTNVDLSSDSALVSSILGGNSLDTTMYDNYPPYYFISSVIDPSGNVVTTDLEAKLSIPDDYFFIMPNGISLVNDEPILRVVVPIVDSCLLPYNITYSFPFSYVLSIKDDLLAKDAYYNIAEYSSIISMTPSNECGYEDIPDNEGIFMPLLNDESELLNSLEEIVGEVSEDVEEEVACREEKEIVVSVKDESGNPVSGANVLFGPCFIGVTNEYGMVKGKVNEGEFLLRIDAGEGYVFYSKLHDTREERYISITLPRTYETSEIDMDYVVIKGRIVDTCSGDEETCPEYVPKRSMVDIGSFSPYVAPTDVVFEVEKCEIVDEYKFNLPTNDAVRIDVSMTYNYDMGPRYYPEGLITLEENDEESINVQVDEDVMEDVVEKEMDVGLYFVSSISEEISGSEEGNSKEKRFILPFGKQNVDILMIKKPVDNENINTEGSKSIIMLGKYSFSSNDFIYSNKRSSQIVPKQLKRVIVPVIEVSAPEEEIYTDYLYSKYLDIGFVISTLYEDSNKAQKYLEEGLTRVIYEGCRIDPLGETREGVKIYPINWENSRADEVLASISQECGIDPGDYCSYTPDDDVSCNREELIAVLRNEGCYVTDAVVIWKDNA